MSTFYMPPRGAPGSPVFDPDNVHSLLGFFDDLEYCFDAAGVQDETAKKQHATRYAPDSEKAIWRSFPEFTDRDSDYDIVIDHDQRPWDGSRALKVLNRKRRRRARTGNNVGTPETRTLLVWIARAS